MPPETNPTKAARNQSLFREINERIRELNADGGPPSNERWDFLCECASTDCSDVISLTHPEYEAIRRIPTHFPVKPGHVVPDVERVLESNDRYAVVEKFGEAGRVAVQMDSRNTI